jgi:hypothetical protein
LIRVARQLVALEEHITEQPERKRFSQNTPRYSRRRGGCRVDLR